MTGVLGAAFLAGIAGALFLANLILAGLVVFGIAMAVAGWADNQPSPGPDEPDEHEGGV